MFNIAEYVSSKTGTVLFVRKDGQYFCSKSWHEAYTLIFKTRGTVEYIDLDNDFSTTRVNARADAENYTMTVYVPVECGNDAKELEITYSVKGGMSAKEVPTSLSEEIDNLKEGGIGGDVTTTRTGALVTMDCDEGSEIVVNGETTESVTLVHCGKNLLPIYAQPVTKSGITSVVNADGTITFTGTCTADVWPNHVFKDTPLYIPAGTYTVTVNGLLESTTGNRFSIAYADSNSPLAHMSSATGPVTFTTDGRPLSANFAIKKDTVFTGETVSVQLEVGEESTAYEPHVENKIAGAVLPTTLVAYEGVNTVYTEAANVLTVTARKSVGEMIDEAVAKKITDYDQSVKKTLEYMMRRKYDIIYANSSMPIDLKGYTGDNQIIHPKVLYFQNKFGGHSFWMAYTPYPFGLTAYENPCVAYSDDGYEWTNIDGNPLDDPAGNGYYSDTHLVYIEATGTMELWYRYVGDYAVEPVPEIIYRRTSTNGINWSEKEVVINNDGGYYAEYTSPSVIHDGSKYKLWVANERYKEVYYYESTDGTNFDQVRVIDLDYVDSEGASYHLYHIDVIEDNGQTILLAMCKNNSDNKWSLFMSTSADNITFTTPVVVMYGNPYGWDKQIYRASIVNVEGEYRIYYSARDNTTERRGIGISTSNKLSEFVGKF